jgi:hypothetical protein
MIIHRKLKTNGDFTIEPVGDEFSIRLTDEHNVTYYTKFKLKDVEQKCAAHWDAKSNSMVGAQYFIPYSGVGTHDPSKLLIQEDIYTLLLTEATANNSEKVTPEIHAKALAGIPIIRKKEKVKISSQS